VAEIDDGKKPFLGREQRDETRPEPSQSLKKWGTDFNAGLPKPTVQVRQGRISKAGFQK